MYPLLFKSLFCPKIWGYESWAISAYSDQQTTVANGALAGQTLQQVLEQYGAELVGKHVYEQFGNRFPLLFKYIQADDDLSVQVHPNDEQAEEMEHGLGKNEMWYVLPGTGEEAKVVFGWQKKTSAKRVEKAIEDGTLMELLNVQRVKAGDVMQINAGTVHALKAGARVAEIQENSDVTYRLYDYNRRDAAGNLRELHIEKALKVLNYDTEEQGIMHIDARPDLSVAQVHTSYYATSLLHLSQPALRDYEGYDSFVALLCVKGVLDVQAGINGEKVALREGEGMIIPAYIAPMVSHVMLTPRSEDVRLLETFIP